LSIGDLGVDLKPADLGPVNVGVLGGEDESALDHQTGQARLATPADARELLRLPARAVADG